MQLSNIKKYLRIPILVLAFTGCGPMNTQPKSIGAQSNQTAEASKLSKNSLFYAYLSQTNGNSAALGDNEYSTRLVYSKNLSNLSQNAKVTFSYSMPAMPDMGKSEAQGIRQSDGSYIATLFYSMSGRWEVILKIEDNEIQDEYQFDVAL